MCASPLIGCGNSVGSHSIGSQRNRSEARVRLGSFGASCWAAVRLYMTHSGMREPARSARRAFSCLHPSQMTLVLNRIMTPAGAAADHHRISPPMSPRGRDLRRGPLSPRYSGNGIMGFPWNMPCGILFFTTRSPRFAAFLSGTETLKSEIHDLIASAHVIGPQART
jgi:hypothetical protein